jgi:hypothetical protein
LALPMKIQKKSVADGSIAFRDGVVDQPVIPHL